MGNFLVGRGLTLLSLQIKTAWQRCSCLTGVWAIPQGKSGDESPYSKKWRSLRRCGFQDESAHYVTAREAEIFPLSNNFSVVGPAQQDVIIVHDRIAKINIDGTVGLNTAPEVKMGRSPTFDGKGW